MAYIRVHETGRGMHPSEVVVEVSTANGRKEKLIVDRRSVKNGRIFVGYPVGVDIGKYLIELPRETLSGAWRIWVPADALEEEQAA